MRHFFSWLWLVAQWLWKPKLLWLSLLVVAIAIGFAMKFGASEKSWRLSGLFLQLFGILTVVWGINTTRRQFNLPTLTSVTANWFREFPKYRGTKVIGLSAASMCLSGGAAGLTMWANLPENPSIEDRIRVAERNLEYLHSDFINIQTKVDIQHQALTGLVKEEEARRAQEISKLNQSMLELGTGGIQISAIGALWLFVGVILSTAAPELEKILK